MKYVRMKNTMCLNAFVSYGLIRKQSALFKAVALRLITNRRHIIIRKICRSRYNTIQYHEY